LLAYIDWTFFFHAWELKGRFPQILDHPLKGKEARKLYDDGRRLLDRIVHENLLRLSYSWGFWPANADGDDIVLYVDGSRTVELGRFHMLRQQDVKPDANKPHLSLADYIAPLDSGREDYLGAFALATGIGCDELVARFEAEHDDYSAILAKALADRLAEAGAEFLHKQARIAWGYDDGRSLTNEDLIAERYRGIRPAFGYPACPDHTEKQFLWEILRAEEAGMQLTENFATLPAAAVSGIYFSRPESHYFGVGRVGHDQVVAYAARKNRSVEEIERWLAPYLAYPSK
jgi:5-methyltetrahydrofolate--homocysteine methyltransferase